MRESRSQSPEINDHRWHPPGRFKNYILEKEIDGGGMGIVYKARTINDQKPVAIKFLLDSGQYKRFRREIDTGQSLQHPNFVRFHDTGEIDDHFYIVMDYIEGQPLKKYMEMVNLSTERRLEIFYTIVSAVGYAHNIGIIHRDLKPGNILIDDKEEPIILDFGLAKYIKNQDDVTALTIEGQILGTPGYMSPEQARGEVESQDERTDVFCLGIILYEMLTARNPFDGANFLEVCYNIAHKSPVPIEQFVPGIPPKLAYIVNRALARSQDMRYQNAQEFAYELYNFLVLRQKGKQIQGIVYPQDSACSVEADTVPPVNLASEQYSFYSNNQEKMEPRQNVLASNIVPPTPPGPNRITERVKKIMCTYCGAINSPSQERCQECSQSLRPFVPEENRSIPKQEKSPIAAPKYGVAKEIQKIKAQQAKPSYAKHTPKQPVPAKNVRARAIPVLEPVEQEEKDTSLIYLVLGAIGMTISLFPSQRELLAPWYASGLDIIFGSISGFLLGKYGKNGLHGGILFCLFAGMSFIFKYFLHFLSKPSHGETVLEIFQGLFLACLLGFILGLIHKKT